MEQFLPYTLSIKASALSDVAKWSSITTQEYEVQERLNWPENGLSFAKGMLKIMCGIGFQHDTLSFRTAQMQLVLKQQRYVLNLVCQII